MNSNETSHVLLQKSDFEDISFSNGDTSILTLGVAEENNNEDLHSLEKYLAEGLERHEIKNPEDIEEEIEEKNANIEKFLKKKQLDKSTKERQALEDLQNLSVISFKIKALKSSSSKEDETLRAELNEGLRKHEITDPATLVGEIVDKEEEISKLERKGKTESALKRKESLKSLKRLQDIFEKLNKAKNIDQSQISEELKGEQILPTRNLMDLSSRFDQKDEIKSSPTQNLMNLYSNFDQRKEKQNPTTRNLMDLPSEFDQKEEKSSPPVQAPEEMSDTDQKKKEDLENVYSDFIKIPKCSEKSILGLICYISIRMSKNLRLLEQVSLTTAELDEEINQEFRLLKNRLNIEELCSSKISHLVDASCELAKNNADKSSLDMLRVLLKEIRSLNIQEVLRLVEKANTAANLLKNQDIFFFLGETGSGKSTTIHFFAGSKMTKTTVKGLTHIAPTDIKNPTLKSITTSPLGTSETRYISSVLVTYKEVGARSRGSIILCDSLGFGDTNGPEVDIANGVGVIKAVQESKSVKPIVLISYKSVGDRLTGLKNMAHLLVGMIKNIEDHLKAFTYIFTKYPSEEKKEIHDALDNIRASMNEEEESDGGFVSFVNDMVEKTEDGAITIDPIADKPSKVLDHLASSANISYPGDVFQFSIAEKSKATIQEQLRKHQSSITISIGRSDYPLIIYKLNEMKQLYACLDSDNIKQIYSECTRSVTKKINEYYKSSTSRFSSCLLRTNQLNEEDVTNYKECIIHAESAEELRRLHLGDEATESNQYLQHLKNEVKNISSELLDEEIDSPLVKTTLDKIRLLSNSFSSINAGYIEVLEVVTSKFESLIKLFKSSVSSQDFVNAAIYMRKIELVISSLTNHLDAKLTDQKYAQVKSCLNEVLQKSVKDSEKILDKKQVEEADVQALNEQFSVVQSIQNTPDLLPKSLEEEGKRAYQAIRNRTTDYFEKLNLEIENKFASQRETSFSTIEGLFKQMELLRTIPVVKNQTSETYYKTLEKLCGFVSELRRDAEQTLNQIYDDKDHADYSRMFRCLDGLKDAEWLEAIRPGVHKEEIAEINKKIVKHVEELQSFITEANFDLDDYSQLSFACRALTKVNKMKPLEQAIDQLGLIIEEINTLFNTRAKESFEFIEKFISKTQEEKYRNFDPKTAEKVLCYLEECKKSDLLLSRGKSLLGNMNELVRSYGKICEEEAKSSYNTIINYKSGEKDDLSQNAEILASRLQDVKSFKIKYPKVFLSFDPEDKLFEEWERRLDKKLYDLSDEMESLSAVKQNQALNDKFKIVKSLSQLDEVLGKDKCRQVYSKYQDQFHKSAPSQLQKGIDAVRSKDYSSVFSIMSTLEQESKSGIILSKDHLDQLKKILNDDLGLFIEKTVSMARMVQMIENTTPEKIQPIEDNLAKIQLAKALLSKFLTPGVNITDKISRIVKTVSNAVLELLENIRNLMDSHNFIELDKKKKSLNLICDILSTHCEEEVLDELKKLKEVETKIFENLTKKYSELDIKQYFMHPPKDICKKLGQAKETNSNCRITLQKIEQNIVDKFRRELENAKSLEQVDTLPNPHLRAFESALNSLPENLKDQLKQDLQNCKDDLQKSMDDYKAELVNISQSSDPIRMRNFLVKCEGEGRSSTIKSAKSVMSKQIQETVVEIDNMLENEDLLGAILPIKKLYSFKKNLAEDMNEIKSACINVWDRLLKIFNEAYTSFKIPLLDSDVTLSEESCKKVEKSFDCLVDFLAFVSRLDEYEISQELFGEDTKQNLLESHEIVSNLILNQQKKYRESVETNNHSLLKDVLDAMKRYDKLKNY